MHVYLFKHKGHSSTIFHISSSPFCSLWSNCWQTSIIGVELSPKIIIGCNSSSSFWKGEERSVWCRLLLHDQKFLRKLQQLEWRTLFCDQHEDYIELSFRFYGWWKQFQERGSCTRGHLHLKCGYQTPHPLRDAEPLYTPISSQFAKTISIWFLDYWLGQYLRKSCLSVQVAIFISWLVVPLIN